MALSTVINPRRLRKQLSPRECQILELLIANNNNKRIAALLGNLALMEGGNTLVHRAGIINAQLLHDMDSMAVDRFLPPCSALPIKRSTAIESISCKSWALIIPAR
jgi:hypothetical protein